MKRVLIAALMAVAILAVGMTPALASEGETTLMDQRVWGDGVTYKNCYPSSCSSAATAYRYGSVIDCRKAQTIEWCVTTSSTGATTYVIVGVEWLLDDPSDPVSDGPYGNITYYPGFGLLEGTAATTITKANLDPWTYHEQFMLSDTLTTLPTNPVAPTTATVSIGIIWDTGLNQYRAFTATKAPYCRPYVYYKVADTTSAWVVLTDGSPVGEGIVRISAMLRYRPWPSYRAEEASEAKGTWYGYPWVW